MQDGDGWDEELPERPRRARPRLERLIDRLRGPLTALAALGVGLAALYTLVPGGTGRIDSLVPPPRPIPVHVLPLQLPAPDVYPGGGAPVGAAVPDTITLDTTTGAACPNGYACRTRTDVPAALRSAVLARFPHARRIAVTSLEVNHAWVQWQLVSRMVVVADGTRTLRIAVVTGRAPVAVVSGHGARPSPAAVRALLADPRLRAVQGVSRGLGNGPGQH